jgi:ribonuclease P/MRP protein subunit RPP1
MTGFHDFFISEELREEAVKLGWNKKSVKSTVKILTADNWGELKAKISEHRESHDILAFRGSNHTLIRKAFSDPRMDVVLQPGKDRKDSGMNHVDAERASENQVAVGFSLKSLPESSKRQSQELNKWRRNLKLCQKYNTPFLITTEADAFEELRKPRDLASIISSLGYNGSEAVKKHPSKILERLKQASSDSQVRPGHEVLEE